MRLLLDTHAFLWFIEGSPNLSDIARSAIEDRNNQRFLSVASLWEMSIKVSIGKLELEMTFADLVKHEVDGNAIELLEIQPEHLDELAKLPFSPQRSIRSAHNRSKFSRVYTCSNERRSIWKLPSHHTVVSNTTY